MLKSFFNGALNFILPNSCISCGEIIPADVNYLCNKCYSKLEPYNDIHPWQQEMINEGIIDNSLSAFWFREGTPIQPLFHALKYQNMKRAGLMLGEEIGKIMAKTNSVSFNYIVPVPLHKSRFRDRTYNQSEFIARGISNIISVPVLNDGVIRVRFTGTQTRLNKSQRKENVLGAFEANPKHAKKITGRNIVLADDVITTGATILECAASLKKASAGKIWVCSAAYAELKLNIV